MSTVLTAETAIVGTTVRKTATGQAIWTIAEVKTEVRHGKECTSIRVRKVSASKGGLWYPLKSIFTV